MKSDIHSKSERWRTAYHEAGHACVYLVFGQQLVEATVESSIRGFEGHVQPRLRRRTSLLQQSEIRAFVERELLVTCAGDITELRFITTPADWEQLEMTLPVLRRFFDETFLPSDSHSERIGELIALLQTKCFGDLSVEMNKCLRSSIGDLIVLRMVMLLRNRTFWRTVQKVARALFEKGTLKGEEIEEIARVTNLHRDTFLGRFPRFHFVDFYPFDAYETDSE
jgi:hypothetical protein